MEFLDMLFDIVCDDKDYEAIIIYKHKETNLFGDVVSEKLCASPSFYDYEAEYRDNGEELAFNGKWVRGGKPYVISSNVKELGDILECGNELVIIKNGDGTYSFDTEYDWSLE